MAHARGGRLHADAAAARNGDGDSAVSVGAVPVRVLVGTREAECPYCVDPDFDPLGNGDDVLSQPAEEDTAFDAAQAIAAEDAGIDTTPTTTKPREESDEEFELRHEEATQATVAAIVSDGNYWCGVIYCDCCDRAYWARDEDDLRDLWVDVELEDFDTEWARQRSVDRLKHDFSIVSPSMGDFLFGGVLQGNVLIPRALLFPGWVQAVEWIAATFGEDVLPRSGTFHRMRQ